MSETLNKYLPSGIAMLLIFAMIVGGYYILEAKKISEQGKEQSEQNGQDIKAINTTLSNFVDSWFNRVQKSNVIQNDTQSHLLELEQNQNRTILQLVELLNGRTPLFDRIISNLTALSNDTSVGRDSAVANLSQQHEMIIKILRGEISASEAKGEIASSEPTIKNLPPGLAKK